MALYLDKWEDLLRRQGLGLAKEYGVKLKQGSNVVGYINFMVETKKQVEPLGGEAAVGRNPLKAIDEFNYCTYTKHWTGKST